MTSLVFDLGGTHLRAAIAADGHLTHLSKQRLQSVSEGFSPMHVWSDVRARLREYIARNLDGTDVNSPMVLAFPGPIDANGRILQAPTLVGGDSDIPDLGAELSETYGRPVHVINDLSAAAWYLSELVTGRFLVVTVSSGIGSKTFVPNAGVLDDVAYAGEIGHCVVDYSADAILCDCGGRGHLGAIASGRGTARYARAYARREPVEFRSSHCVTHSGATADTLTNEAHLVRALHAEDPWAIQVVRHCARFLARSVVQAIVIGGLERVVVIGGFALAAGESYLGILRAAAEECCDYDLLKGRVGSMITLGDLGEEACLAGAAVYVRRMARA